MSFRFFSDFDEFFNDRDNVALSVVPLRLLGDSVDTTCASSCASKRAMAKKNGTGISRPFGWNGMHNQARMDMTETAHDCTIKMELPGVAKEDVQISYDEATRILTVEAERREEHTTCSDDQKSQDSRAKKTESECDVTEQKYYCHQERYFGRIQRAITLPDNVDGEGVQAALEHGILRLVFPKRPERDTRKRIDIQ